MLTWVKLKTLQIKSNVRGITHSGKHILFCVPGKGVMKINIENENKRQGT